MLILCGDAKLGSHWALCKELYVAKLFQADEVGQSTTNIAGTDERDLVAGHSVTFFPIALPRRRNSTWERD